MLLIMTLSACASVKAPSSSDSSVSSGYSEPVMVEESASGASESIEGSRDRTDAVQAGIITAGEVDDNLNFSSYQRYLNNTLQSNLGQVLPEAILGDRVTLKILGETQQGISNAWVMITPEGSDRPIVTTHAANSGVFHFFPTLDGANGATKFIVNVRQSDAETPLIDNFVLDLEMLPPNRTVELPVTGVPGSLPLALDLMLVIDTTGSMSDELNYLTTEFRSIVSTIQSQYPQTSLRFGLIVYRDEGDEYVVRSFNFTDSVDEMQQHLSEQHSSGGGDYPEAVHQALATALDAQWRGGNVARLLFWVADAPSHTEHHATVMQQARTARQMGLRVYPLAASGVADESEYLMRYAALITHGRYLFLTDDSGVGNKHAEPKIPCYPVTRLDQLMIRVIASELAGTRIEPTSDQIIRMTGQYDNGICAMQE